MKIRCAIIDDEHLARKYVANYVAKLPFLELVGNFQSPLKLYEPLSQGEIDLLFLDIQMPDMSGLDFLRSLDKKPWVIITTAYKEYALEGYELNVLDYLLKPFSFDRFVKAANKAHQIIQHSAQAPNEKAAAPPAQADVQDDYLIIRADRKYYKVRYDELLFIEGQKAYVTLHLKGRKNITALLSMKQLEEQLPAAQFVRIHKSYMVAISAITALEGFQVELGDTKLPVSKSYRAAVHRALGLGEG